MVTHDPRAAARASRRLYVDKGVLGQSSDRDTPREIPGRSSGPASGASPCARCSRCYPSRSRSGCTQRSTASRRRFDDALDGDDERGAHCARRAAVNVRVPLPLSYRARIESVPGVRDVGVLTFVGGYYRESVEQIEVIAIDIDRIDTGSFDVDEAYVEAMRRTRTGAIIGPELVSRYGWKIGDRVTVRSPVWSKADGSNDWTFDIVGIYGIPEGEFPADGGFWINYDYFDEERTFAKGTIDVLHGARRRRGPRRRDRSRDRRAVRELDRRDADAKRVGFLSGADRARRQHRLHR